MYQLAENARFRQDTPLTKVVIEKIEVVGLNSPKAPSFK